MIACLFARIVFLCLIVWIGGGIVPSILSAQAIEQDPPSDTAFTPDWDWSAEQFLANELIYSFGGQNAWNDSSWNLAFDAVVKYDQREVDRYSYQWNRRTNECIAQGKTPDGRPWIVHFTDVKARTGTASVNGKPVQKREMAEILKMTAERFEEQRMHFLLPFYLLDRSVLLRMEPDTVLIPSPENSSSNSPSTTVGSSTQPKISESGINAPGESQHPSSPPKNIIAVLRAEFGSDNDRATWMLFLTPSKVLTATSLRRPDGTEQFYWWDKVKKIGDLRLATRRQSFDRTVTLLYENVRIGDFDLKE